MKILLVNHFPLRGSGSGTYVADIAKNLTKRNHEVCIIMPENTTDIEEIENVKIHPVFFTRDEKIEGALDFNFACMDPHPRSNLLYEQMTAEQEEQYVDAFRKAIKLEIQEFKPDVIHSQHIWLISSVLKEFDIPYIITSHGAEFITYKKTDRFDKYGFKAMDGAKKVIVISNDNMEEVSKKFPEATNKLELVKNGYNSKEFYMEDVNKTEILKKFSINKNFEKIILFVGRVTQLKGLDVLLKAAKIYEKDNIVTLIAGDGEYRQALNKQKEELGLKNIIFLGSRAHSELRELYNIADVFVLPSRKEAMPLVAIESLACGTPAVVTNHSGMDQIITKDVGLVFEMDNEKMLAEKIEMILNKEVVFDKKELATYAKSRYSIDFLVDKLLEIYNEIK
ncbi:MAG: glycosyltransferase family 4 protein [Clostridia bacterium]|nr:glycosyltransferase family 4 protein [Clostridia bacterium]